MVTRSIELSLSVVVLQTMEETIQSFQLQLIQNRSDISNKITDVEKDPQIIPGLLVVLKLQDGQYSSTLSRKFNFMRLKCYQIICFK